MMPLLIHTDPTKGYHFVITSGPADCAFHRLFGSTSLHGHDNAKIENTTQCVMSAMPLKPSACEDRETMSCKIRPTVRKNVASGLTTQAAMLNVIDRTENLSLGRPSSVAVLRNSIAWMSNMAADPILLSNELPRAPERGVFISLATIRSTLYQ